MGYTHYWGRKIEFKQEAFGNIVKDFLTVLPDIEAQGVKLADGHGKGAPIININEIVFNGPEHCGHPKEDLGITWPAKSAGGVLQEIDKKTVAGSWFAGAELTTRRCGGDCSHETFYLPRILKPESYQKPEKGKYFEFCKTAYKPYDLAVTAVLIIASRYLGNDIKISSDGENKDWFDAALLCQKRLNYGLNFKIR